MINNRWQFDEEFLIKTIKDAKKMLKSKNVSDSTKSLLQDTICQFSEFLEVNSDDYVKVSNKNNDLLDFQVIKKKFINKAIWDYRTIDKELIDMLIYLHDNHTYLCFNGEEDNYSKDTIPDEIVYNSLKIYDKFIPEFVPVAHSIIDYPINLINFVKEKKIDSQCFYDAIFQLPFIHVENSSGFPPGFIHELEHGIERIKGYRCNRYMYELGPILMETLYIDEMVKQKEFDAIVLYFSRIEEAEAFLDYLASYFKCLKILKKCNFNLSTDKFMRVLRDCNLIYNGRLIVSEMLNEDFNVYIMYLLSFFKSLEIRDKMYQDKKYGLQCLKNCLKGKQAVHLNGDEVLQRYEDYLQEVILKDKNSPHTKKYSK